MGMSSTLPNVSLGVGSPPLVAIVGWIKWQPIRTFLIGMSTILPDVSLGVGVSALGGNGRRGGGKGRRKGFCSLVQVAAHQDIPDGYEFYTPRCVVRSWFSALGGGVWVDQVAAHQDILGGYEYHTPVVSLGVGISALVEGFCLGLHSHGVWSICLSNCL